MFRIPDWSAGERGFSVSGEPQMLLFAGRIFGEFLYTEMDLFVIKISKL